MVIISNANIQSRHRKGHTVKEEELRSWRSGFQWSCAGATEQHVELELTPFESEGCRRLVAGFYVITIINY